MKKTFIIACLLFACGVTFGQIAEKQTYLSDFKEEMKKKWPTNRTLNIVFHGHSVPSGYFHGGVVNTMQAYPHLTFHGIKAQYPFTVLNVITTSIGGEQAEQGEKRFSDEVLTHRPDVLFIDYALNDRSIGLERSEKAWRKMIEKALESNKPALEVMYSPDGNYPEGSGYWCYGTLYQVLMLAALNSTLGTDNGLSDTPGFSKTAEYMLYMTGLNSKFFNYSDCAPSSTAALASWWFADKYSNPSLLYNELKMLKNGEYASCAENRLLPMIMAFANNLNLDAISAPSNKLWSGKGETPVVMVHTDWTYTDTDKYLGIKGGKAGSSHGHMDAGSFVYDAYGVRWSMDFGLQSYTTLESVLAGLGGNLWDMGQNSMRWDVFRLNNLNHSTISINDARHRVNGAATLTTTINTATELGATFDLTEVVSDQAASATRTVKIVNDKDLVVMDEIKARTDKSAKVRWCMVTPAIPTVESNRIVLTNGSKVMYLTASGSVKPTYKQWSTTSENSYDQANPGTYMVGFEATVTANQTATFTTTLSPK